MMRIKKKKCSRLQLKKTRLMNLNRSWNSKKRVENANGSFAKKNAKFENTLCDSSSFDKRLPKTPFCFGQDENCPEEPTKPIVAKEPATTHTTATTEAPSKTNDLIDDDIILEEIQLSSEEKSDKDGVLPLEEWAIKKQLCRCCLVEGIFDSLHSPAPGDDITYDDMLMQCFNIELFPVSSDVTAALRGVCGLCAARLRDAYAFRHQVSATEARFRDLYTRNCITVAGAAIMKVEIDQDIDNYFDFGLDDTDTDENCVQKHVERKKKVEPSPRREKNEPKSQSQKKVAAAPAQPQKTKAKKKCRKPSDAYVWTDGAYKCTQCERTSAKSNNMLKHFRRVHLGQRNPFKCKLCESGSFSYEGQLVKHRFEEHNIDDRHKCGACDKAFYLKVNLKKHIDCFHMMGVKTKCSMCDFECFSKLYIKRHMDKHKTSKDFQCKYCKKLFLRKGTLRMHEKIHTGDKRKQCAECGQAFVQKASLNYHMAKYHPEVKF